MSTRLGLTVYLGTILKCSLTCASLQFALSRSLTNIVQHVANKQTICLLINSPLNLLLLMIYVVR